MARRRLVAFAAWIAISLQLPHSHAFAADGPLASLDADYKRAIASADAKKARSIAQQALSQFPSPSNNREFILWEIRAAYSSTLNDDNAAAERFYRDACPRLGQLQDLLRESECLGSLGALLFIKDDQAGARRIFNTLSKRPVVQRGVIAAIFLASISDQQKEKALAATLSYTQEALTKFPLSDDRSDGFLANTITELSIRFAGELINTPLQEKGIDLINRSLNLFASVIGRLNPELTRLMVMALETLPPDRQRIELANWAIELATSDPNSTQGSALFSTAIDNLKFGDREDDISLSLWRWLNHVQKRHGSSSVYAADALSLIGERLFDRLEYAEGQAVYARVESLIKDVDDDDPMKKGIAAKIKISRDYHLKSDKLKPESVPKLTEALQSAKDKLLQLRPRQPGRRDLNPDEVALIAEKMISDAQSGTDIARLGVLGKASYDILYPADVDPAHTLSDEENAARHGQYQRICALGMEIAQRQKPLHPMYLQCLTGRASSVSISSGPEEALRFIASALAQAPAPQNTKQRLTVLSAYPRFFGFRVQRYRLGPEDETDALAILDSKLSELLGLWSALKTDEEKAEFFDALRDFTKVFIDNFRYSSAERAMKAAENLGSAKIVQSQLKYVSEELKSAREKTAQTEGALRDKIEKIAKEKDSTERNSLLDDALMHLDVDGEYADVSQFQITLSRRAIADQVSDLSSRAAALSLSPFSQINWRHRLMDRYVFDFLGGAVQGRQKLPKTRVELVDEALSYIQLRANNRTDSALLRSAARSLLNTSLGQAARQFDSAFVSWVKTNKELVNRIAYGDTVVDDEMIRVLEKARSQSIEAHRSLASGAPNYVKLVGFEPYSAANISRVLSKDEALICYVYDDLKGLFAVVITNEKRTIYDLNAYAKPRGMGALELGTALEKHAASLKGSGVDFDNESAEAIHRYLISPIQQEIEGKNRLIVVPDGELLNVTFAALREPRASPDGPPGAWLVNSHAITTALSIKSLLTLRQRQAESGPNSFVAFSDPSIQDETGLCARYSGWLHRDEKSQGICPLPETRDQAVAFAQVVGSDPDQSVVEGSNLSLKTVEERLALHPRTIMFATHALRPDESKVLLGSEQPALLIGENNSGGSVKSSWLTADKIELFNLDADLVVLSACNTGAAEGGGGAALSGLARAFFEAGARGVMATSWYVDAPKTRELLVEIAREAKSLSNSDIPAAMQAAMAVRARQGLTPRDWALFTYVGR
jgi:CHAT domain-containing protein/uncharacterized protein (DUF2267 family)